MVEINSARLWNRIEALSRFTDPAKPWTRRSFDPEFVKGRKWLAQEFRAAGLATTLDAGGNLIGRLPGADNTLGALVAGSHSDSVPSGGRFDGMLGLLAALEVAQSFREQRITLCHALEVVDFLAEEPSEFGISCIGSRTWAGALTASDLARRFPPDTTLSAAIDGTGGNSSKLDRPLRTTDSVAAYVEVHIEQGLVLPERNAHIGIVTAIVGIRRYQVSIKGRADHAGTTPMSLRLDALAGAAELIRTVENLALSRVDDPAYLVATVGKLSLEPNAVNAIPGQVDLIVEVRSTEQRAMDDFEAALQKQTAAECKRRRLQFSMLLISQTAPTACSTWVQDAIEEASGVAQLRSTHLPSGAGHDGVFIARIAPVGMIFVPCKDGRSHAPEEWAEPQDCANGARVLAETLLILDRNSDTVEQVKPQDQPGTS